MSIRKSGFQCVHGSIISGLAGMYGLPFPGRDGVAGPVSSCLWLRVAHTVNPARLAIVWQPVCGSLVTDWRGLGGWLGLGLSGLFRGHGLSVVGAWLWTVCGLSWNLD